MWIKACFLLSDTRYYCQPDWSKVAKYEDNEKTGRARIRPLGFFPTWEANHDPSGSKTHEKEISWLLLVHLLLLPLPRLLRYTLLSSQLLWIRHNLLPPPPTRTRKRPPMGREQMFIEMQHMHKELLAHMDFFRSTRVREMEVREENMNYRTKYLTIFFYSR